MDKEKNNVCGCCNGYYHGGHRKFFKIILILLVAFFAAKAFGWVGYGHKGTDQNSIVVSGKGEIAVKPDIATISFSVMEEDLDVSKASDAVNTKIGKIVAALKADGIDEKDIKTTGYTITPRYNYLNSPNYPYGGKQVLAGYDVTDSIDLKIRDISKVGKIVTDLSVFNVTNMSGLNFTEDKYDDLVRQARDQAIADAREQAKSLAKSLGVSLGKIMSYSEGGNYPRPYYATMSADMGGMAKSEAVLPTGEDKITSNVTITYEIR